MAQIEVGLKFVYSNEEMAEMRAVERRQIEEEKRYRMQKPRMRLPWRIRKGEIIRVLVRGRKPMEWPENISMQEARDRVADWTRDAIRLEKDGQIYEALQNREKAYRLAQQKRLDLDGIRKNRSRILQIKDNLMLKNLKK